MTNDKIITLLLWLTREVARLHATNASLQTVVEELRVLDSRLDDINAAQVQVDAWQEFYERIEDISPEIAALIDTRSEQALGLDGDS